MVSGIYTELSAASECITCSTATKGGAEGTLSILFISKADVDGQSTEMRLSEMLLLSNLQAEEEETQGTYEFETTSKSYVTARELDAARTSP